MSDRIHALRELADVLEAMDTQTAFNRLQLFKPYPKQAKFIELGATKRERLFMAANQIGKTETGAYETACHLTGLYPDDWKGRKWDRPVKAWAAGESGLVTRDASQKKLCGEPGVAELFGTGMIPRHLFVDDPTRSRGVSEAFDTIQVRHVSGGISVLRFKSYEQGRTKFQAETLDFVWCDEEPPSDVYSEILTRITATQGMVFVTFTPLKGPTEVVLKYTDEPSPDRVVVTMTIDEAEHISPEYRKKIIAGYRPHEREARAKGIPMMGEGRVFLCTEEHITEPPIEYVPEHWAKLWAIDFGMGHPFAAVLLLWDRDLDVLHVHKTIKMADAIIMQHAARMKQVAAAVPVAWPHDGHQRDRQSGEPMSRLYKAEGLQMYHEHATWPTGGYSMEAGLTEMDERMKNGKLKVSRELAEWLEEYRFYHRKDGVVVPLKDDLMSATRVGVMMKRIAKPVPLGNYSRAKRRGPNAGLALNVDFDLS